MIKRTIQHTVLIQLVLVIALTVLLQQVGITQAETNTTDEQLVYAAVEDYVLGLYDVAPERIERSVDTLLHKVGYYDYNNESYNHVPMTYKQLHELSANWNIKGDQAKPDSPQKIEIYDVNDKTASAKLTAVWGIDLMHLSKVDGRWKIMNIMWQSNPK